MNKNLIIDVVADLIWSI